MRDWSGTGTKGVLQPDPGQMSQPGGRAAAPHIPRNRSKNTWAMGDSGQRWTFAGTLATITSEIVTESVTYLASGTEWLYWSLSS